MADDFEVQIKQKALTLQEWMDRILYERMGKVLVPKNPDQVAKELIPIDDVLAVFAETQRQQLQDFIRIIEKDYIFHDEHHSGYFISKIDWELLKGTVLSEGSSCAKKVQGLEHG